MSVSSHHTVSRGSALMNGNKLDFPVCALILWFLILATQPVSAQENATQVPEVTNGVVVLDDGRVFSGAISSVPGGYRVEWAGTYAIVPFTKVDVTAPTLSEAYVALRDRVLKPTAEDHLELAEWCLRNNLVGQAQAEVTKALKLEPLREEARLLMNLIDQQLNPQEKPIEVPTVAAMTIDGFLRNGEKSFGGLSRETHQEFIRHIQPLLLNKCGNAYCHGQATKTAFKLAPIQRGTAGNKLQSQSNLEQVLNQLDRQQPANSPLITQATAVDDHHRAIFLGQRNKVHFQVLLSWVEQVGMETSRTSGNTEPQNRVTHADLPAEQSVATVQQTGGIMPEQAQADLFNEKQLLLEVRNQSQPDPFDPDVFNRRVHGASARELRERSTGAELTPEISGQQETN